VADTVTDSQGVPALLFLARGQLPLLVGNDAAEDEIHPLH